MKYITVETASGSSCDILLDKVTTWFYNEREITVYFIGGSSTRISFPEGSEKILEMVQHLRKAVSHE